MKKISNTPERSRKKTSSSGETIVEVLFATVILSAVIAGAYTLTNRATRIGQSAIERTEAVNRVETTAEVLRGMASERGEAWTKIKDTYLSDNEPTYDNPSTCGPNGSAKAFHIRINELNKLDDFDDSSYVESGTLQKESDEDGKTTDSLFTQWIEAYERPNSAYTDFHIRSCWYSISGNEVNRTGAVLRLFTGE